MEDKQLLELCLSITGAFESGVPSYTTVTGNFDGQGISVGCLQWAAGQGSLGHLLQTISTKNPAGWDWVQTFFKSDIHHLAVLKPADAIEFCKDHYLVEGTTHVSPAAIAAWQALLGTPESIAAQLQLAQSSVMSRARALAMKFCPNDYSRTRVYAFFFDLVTQSGGMENKVGKVEPMIAGQSFDDLAAIAVARSKNALEADLWLAAIAHDELAKLLLHYAHQRSLLSKAEYQWDALSRRGAIACRVGFVHGVKVDFSTKLD